MISSRKFSIGRLTRQLRDPAIQAKIKRNKKTRLFDDLPPQFDCIYADMEADTRDLVRILARINPDTVTDESTSDKPGFINLSDQQKIRGWAMEIIQHASSVLLTDSGHTREDILILTGNTRQSLEGREMIYAYFAATTQQIIINLGTSLAYYGIHEKVFKAFNLRLNESSHWINEYLRIEEPQPEQSESSVLAIGIGLGLLLFTSLAAGTAFAASDETQKKTLNPDRKNVKKASDEDYYYSPPASPDMFK